MRFKYGVRPLPTEIAQKRSDPILFTHVPEIWTEGREDPVSWAKSGVYALALGRKTVNNVGSVGLPRGGDKRATWATYDPGKGEVNLRRTAYDVQEVIRTIKHLRHDPVVEAKLLRDLGGEI